MCRPATPGCPAEFGCIWSNPPIRIGKDALHDLLAGWLGRLAPGGRAYLVVQRNLGADSLHRWLSGQGWPTARIASRAGYRVLEVSCQMTAPDGAPSPAANPVPPSRKQLRPTDVKRLNRSWRRATEGAGGAAARLGDPALQRRA